MPKRQDVHEERAIALLQQLVDLDASNRDALPGSAVRHIKEALTILKKRRPTSRPSTGPAASPRQRSGLRSW